MRSGNRSDGRRLLSNPLTFLGSAWTRWWDDAIADVRFAVRLLLKSKTLSAVAVLAIGLGTGANVAVYSALHSVLLAPLPYHDPGQLVVVRQQQTKAGRDTMDFSVSEISDYRASASTLSSLAEYFVDAYVAHAGASMSERVQAGVVSANFFEVFGVSPLIGRPFTAEDERPGAPCAILVSYDYWVHSLGREPDVLGRTLRLNDQAGTIIGVLPPLPPYPDKNDIYLTTTSSPFRMWPERIRNRGRRFARVFARTKPGVALEYVNADLAAIANRLERDHPESYPPEWGYRAVASSVRNDITRSARPAIGLLAAGAAFILAIVCANVANMTLARSVRREHEWTMRAALGASSGRLFRQLVTEAAVLSAAGTSIGVWLAVESMTLLRQLLAHLTPRAEEVFVDRSALVFALSTAAIASLAPAMVVSASMAGRRSRADGRQLSMNIRHARTYMGLVCAQVACSLVLLSGAGLMVRSVLNLQRVDVGVARDTIVTMHLDFSSSAYPAPDAQRRAARRILQETTALPGVASAAVATSFPLDPAAVAFGVRGDWNRFVLEGQPPSRGQLPPVTAIRLVSQAYFRTLGIPIVRGRVFDDTDREGTDRVVIVNRTFAARRLPPDPVGARLSTDGGKTWLTVIGVAGDTAERDLRETPVDEVYYPLEQLSPVPSGDWVRALLVRSKTEPSILTTEVRKTIGQITPDIAIGHVSTLADARDVSLQSSRVLTYLVAIFAAIAFVVSVCGVGSMVALSLGQRLREIALRRALGAQPMDIVTAVLGREIIAVITGLGAGLSAVWALANTLKTFLFGIPATDGPTIAGVSAALLIAAVVASYMPMRRALRIEPRDLLTQ
jgi:putative ABC transport system permease protein